MAKEWNWSEEKLRVQWTYKKGRCQGGREYDTIRLGYLMKWVSSMLLKKEENETIFMGFRN